MVTRRNISSRLMLLICILSRLQPLLDYRARYFVTQVPSLPEFNAVRIDTRPWMVCDLTRAVYAPQNRQDLRRRAAYFHFQLGYAPQVLRQVVRCVRGGRCAPRE